MLKRMYKRRKEIFVVMAIVMLFSTLIFSDVPNLMKPEVIKANDYIQVSVNGKPVKFDAGTGRPNIVNSRTMVPLRVISEDLGYKVDWLAKERKAIVQDNGTKVELAVGSSYALVNGKKTPIDRRDNGEVVETKSYIESQRTYVPLRFVSEALGAKVEHNKVNGNHVIKITTGAQKPVIKDNNYVGGPIETIWRKSTVGILETDKTPAGKGWVEPVFGYWSFNKSSSTPIAIYVDNDNEIPNGMRFDTKIVGKYAHYNHSTVDNIFEGGRMEWSYEEKDMTKSSEIFFFMVKDAVNMIDSKGNPLTLEGVKGQTIEVEIIAKYNGMSKRYVIPFKL